MESQQSKVEKLYQDMYLGNGKPAMTVRMALAEGDIKTVNESVEKINRNLRASMIMLGTLIATVIADVIVHWSAR